MSENGIDGLVGNPEAFPILAKMDFFNHAGVSPIPRAAADALRKFAAEAESTAYFGTSWYRDVEQLREQAGGLLNASKDEISFVKNTSEGIATVANGLEWRAGDRIVTTGVEYPANIYPWMDLSRRFGTELVMVPEQDGADGTRQVPLEAILREASHPRTKLVSLSHVEFASGQRHDLAAVGRFCRENGKLLCVDAIQSLGIIPVDVQAMKIDFLSADGHKWLLGPEGAGIFYCRRELLERMHPLIVGWMNVVDAENFGHYDFTLRKDARRFEAGSHNVPGLLALKASIQLLLSAGIEAVGRRIRRLTDLFIEGVQRKGYRVISPRGDEQWSGIVSFVSNRHLHEPVWRRLREQFNTEIAVREGRLRCSPHFYNSEEQIGRLAEHLPG